jgi:periplasmic protein TonB
MKPNEILQASILDILFENRNKNYGAYPLRKYYPQRIKKSILLAFFIMGGLMFFLSSFNAKEKMLTLKDLGDKERVLNDANKKEIEKEKPKKETPKTEDKKVKKGNESSAKVDVVVSEPVFTKNPLEVSTGTIGSFKNPGGLIDAEEDPGFENGTNTGTKIDSNKTIEPPIVIKQVVDETKPSYEASYIGGKEALGGYLQDNLEGEAIDDGENKKVVIRYCIEADGTVTNVSSDENGDADFMQRAVKVFKKMRK